MFIEDLFSDLTQKMSKPSQVFMKDMVRLIDAGNASTIGQSEKVRETLLSTTNDPDLVSRIKTLPFRKPPLVIKKIPPDVRYIGNNLLIFRCSYDRVLERKLQRVGATFDENTKVWAITVNGNNLDSIMKIIKRFRTDPKTEEYFNNCMSAKNAVTVEDGIVTVTVVDPSLMQFLYTTSEVWDNV